MAKYMVRYEGFAYVEADSEDEAKDVYYNEIDVAYEEKEITSIEEVDDFLVDDIEEDCWDEYE